MKFFKNRAVAIVILVLAIIGSSLYGLSKKSEPAAELIGVSYHQWIADEAGLLSDSTEQPPKKIGMLFLTVEAVEGIPQMPVACSQYLYHDKLSVNSG